MSLSPIIFWNGNKSPIRRQYEKALIALCLNLADGWDSRVIIDETDYPRAEDEGNIFANGCDVLITVDGNQKFAGKPYIKINTPLCKDLLSHRLVITRKDQLDTFSPDLTYQHLQRLTAGIPATWADADILRSNHCQVYEYGNLEHILQALENGQCDYVPLGANEIEAIFNEYDCTGRGLVIEPNHVIHYPLPLVFLINPKRSDVAQRVDSGLLKAMQSGAFDTLFNAHFPAVFTRLNVARRKLHQFLNPNLT